MEQIAAIDGTFFVETQYLKVGSEKRIYNNLLILGEDATQIVEIPIDEPQKEYGEAHIEGIPIYETVYEDYRVYIGDVAGNTNDVLAVEKDGEMYAFRAEAIFMVKDHMVTMDDGRYMYNGTSYGIDEIEGKEVRNFACLSSKYEDDIYTVVRKGRGHNMEDANPSSVEDEYLVKISPETNTTEVLYDANNKTRILGFDIEANEVYLLNSFSVYEYCSLECEGVSSYLIEIISGLIYGGDKYYLHYATNIVILITIPLYITIVNCVCVPRLKEEQAGKLLKLLRWMNDVALVLFIVHFIRDTFFWLESYAYAPLVLFSILLKWYLSCELKKINSSIKTKM